VVIEKQNKGGIGVGVIHISLTCVEKYGKVGAEKAKTLTV
jgi:hypothetical protein